MHTNSGNLVQLGCGKEALELIRRCLQKSQSHRITKQGKCCIRQIHLRNATGATSGRSCNILHNPCAETLENVYSVGLLKCEIAASLGDCRGRREGRVSCTVKFGARSICNPSLGIENALLHWKTSIKTSCQSIQISNAIELSCSLECWGWIWYQCNIYIASFVSFLSTWQGA